MSKKNQNSFQLTAPTSPRAVPRQVTRDTRGHNDGSPSCRAALMASRKHKDAHEEGTAAMEAVAMPQTTCYAPCVTHENCWALAFGRWATSSAAGHRSPHAVTSWLLFCVGCCDECPPEVRALPGHCETRNLVHAPNEGSTIGAENGPHALNSPPRRRILLRLGKVDSKTMFSAFFFKSS